MFPDKSPTGTRAAADSVTQSTSAATLTVSSLAEFLSTAIDSVKAFCTFQGMKSFAATDIAFDFLTPVHSTVSTPSSADAIFRFLCSPDGN
jgi:hypothetical protein